MRQALELSDDGAGGRAKCPSGHALRVLACPAGAVCCGCRRTANAESVVVGCGARKCDFLTCTLGDRCGPLRVLVTKRTLLGQLEVDELWTGPAWEPDG